MKSVLHNLVKKVFPEINEGAIYEQNTFAKLVAGEFPTLNMKIIIEYGARWATYCTHIHTSVSVFPLW